MRFWNRLFDKSRYARSNRDAANDFANFLGDDTLSVDEQAALCVPSERPDRVGNNSYAFVNSQRPAQQQAQAMRHSSRPPGSGRAPRARDPSSSSNKRFSTASAPAIVAPAGTSQQHQHQHQHQHQQHPPVSSSAASTASTPSPYSTIEDLLSPSRVGSTLSMPLVPPVLSSSPAPGSLSGGSSNNNSVTSFHTSGSLTPPSRRSSFMKGNFHQFFAPSSGGSSNKTRGGAAAASSNLPKQPPQHRQQPPKLNLQQQQQHGVESPSSLTSSPRSSLLAPYLDTSPTSAVRAGACLQTPATPLTPVTPVSHEDEQHLVLDSVVEDKKSLLAGGANGGAVVAGARAGSETETATQTKTTRHETFPNGQSCGAAQQNQQPGDAAVTRSAGNNNNNSTSIDDTPVLGAHSPVGSDRGDSAPLGLPGGALASPDSPPPPVQTLKHSGSSDSSLSAQSSTYLSCIGSSSNLNAETLLNSPPDTFPPSSQLPAAAPNFSKPFSAMPSSSGLDSSASSRLPPKPAAALPLIHHSLTTPLSAAARTKIYTSGTASSSSSTAASAATKPAPYLQHNTTAPVNRTSSGASISDQLSSASSSSSSAASSASSPASSSASPPSMYVRAASPSNVRSAAGTTAAGGITGTTLSPPPTASPSSSPASSSTSPKLSFTPLTISSPSTHDQQSTTVTSTPAAAPSPRHLSRAGSECPPPSSLIFERSVQDLKSLGNDKIPQHYSSDDFIPPVLTASTEVLTNDSLDPENVVVQSLRRPSSVRSLSVSEQPLPITNHAVSPGRAQSSSRPSLSNRASFSSTASYSLRTASRENTSGGVSIPGSPQQAPSLFTNPFGKGDTVIESDAATFTSGSAHSKPTRDLRVLSFCSFADLVSTENAAATISSGSVDENGIALAQSVSPVSSHRSLSASPRPFTRFGSGSNVSLGMTAGPQSPSLSGPSRKSSIKSFNFNSYSIGGEPVAGDDYDSEIADEGLEMSSLGETLRRNKDEIYLSGSTTAAPAAASTPQGHQHAYSQGLNHPFHGLAGVRRMSGASATTTTGAPPSAGPNIFA